MQVILLQRVAKLGQMGEVVNVKDGYARNFLLPQGKALRANDGQHQASSKPRKAQLEAHNLETKKEAEAVGRQARRPDLRRDPLGLRRGRALRLRHHP